MAYSSTITVSKPFPDALANVEVKVLADTREEALNAVTFLTECLMGDRAVFVRCWPEADSYTDLATKVTTHAGYSRFALSEDPGKRQSSLSSIMLLPAVDA